MTMTCSQSILFCSTVALAPLCCDSDQSWCRVFAAVEVHAPMLGLKSLCSC